MIITYFTIENIDSGLFRNQVLNKIEAILECTHDIKFEIIVFNSPFHIFNHLKILREYKLVHSDRIVIRYYPILPPLRYVLSSILQSSLIISWLNLFTKFISFNGDVIHCRSYWPAIIALKNTNKPIVFDVRSLYPAESVAAGKLKINTDVYSFWLKQERNCIDNSKAISVVSKPMIKYIENISKNSNIHLNPIIVNTKEIYFNLSGRNKIRKSLGWEDKIIIVYSGSLGYNGLNKPALGSCLAYLSKINLDFRFLFVTSDEPDTFRQLLNDYLIDEKMTFITEARNRELADWLSAADIGVHALPKQLDSDTRLGTKVVEYWASGLPVILNENVGAAVDLALTENIGVVLNPSTDINNLDFLKEIDKLLALDRDEISNFAKSKFDSRKVASEYINIYKNCIKKQ
jgi:glycosyltransferase involved in cell wall biosynthesis